MLEDLIADEEMVITLTKQGYIKRMNANVYRNQHKGGAGVIGMKTKEDDYVTQIMHVRTHNTLLFFTSTAVHTASKHTKCQKQVPVTLAVLLWLTYCH